MIKRLFSLILIESFLFTTLGAELVWAHPSIPRPMHLRARSAAQDGASREALFDALNPEPRSPLFGTKKGLREKIAGQSFAPIQGGAQARNIYLSEDLAIYDLREEAHIFLNPIFKGWLTQRPLLRSIHQWTTRRTSPFAKAVKRRIKMVLRYLYGEEVALRRGFESYQLAAELDLEDLIDPFVLLREVDLQLAEGGEMIHLPRAVARERNDIFLIDRLKELVAEGGLEEAEERTEEVFRIDERLMDEGIANLDLHFLRNTRIRNGRVVLRDLGYLTRDRDLALYLLKRLHEPKGWEESGGHPIEVTAQRLSEFAPPRLVDFYRKRAYEVYSVENFNRHWTDPGKFVAQDGGAGKGEKRFRQLMILRMSWLGVIAAPPLLLALAQLFQNGIAGYAAARELYHWQTDVATGALMTGLSDWFGQQRAYRTKGIPILKRQIGLAALLGGFYGWTFGLFYDWIKPFSFWNRWGLSLFVGAFKGLFYSLLTSWTKSRWLPAQFHTHYDSSHQMVKWATTATVETPVRAIEHALIQGRISDTYWTLTSFSMGTLLSIFGGWSLNRRDPFSRKLGRFFERRLGLFSLQAVGTRREAERFARRSAYPGLLYHGTTEDIRNVIQREGLRISNPQSRRWAGAGIYLYASKESAENVARERAIQRDSPPAVIEAHVSMKYPKRYQRRLDAEGEIARMAGNTLDEQKIHFQGRLKSLGYDGILIGDRDHAEAVVFRENQVMVVAPSPSDAKRERSARDGGEKTDLRPETIDHRPETIDHRPETIDYGPKVAGDGGIRDIATQMWVKYLLRRVKGPEDVPQIAEKLRRIDPSLVSHLVTILSKEKNDFLRWRAVAMFVEVAEEKAAPYLLTDLRNDNPMVRMHAVIGFDLLGATAVPYLLNVTLMDEDPQRQSDALSMLGFIIKDPDAIPPLITRLKDPKISKDHHLSLKLLTLKALSRKLSLSEKMPVDLSPPARLYLELGFTLGILEGHFLNENPEEKKSGVLMDPKGLDTEDGKTFVSTELQEAIRRVKETEKVQKRDTPIHAAISSRDTREEERILRFFAFLFPESTFQEASISPVSKLVVSDIQNDETLRHLSRLLAGLFPQDDYVTYFFLPKRDGFGKGGTASDGGAARDGAGRLLGDKVIPAIVRKQVEKMAVWEMLSVLNLSEARVIRKKGGPEGSMIVTIQIPDRVDRERPPSGLEILQSELLEGRRFELLYNKQGYLIAIFPSMTKALRESIKAAEEGQGGYSTRYYYFDLSRYYFEVPTIGDPNAKTKWDAFAQKAKADQETISAYKKLQGVDKAFKNSNIPIVRPVAPMGQYPYVYVELDRRSGEVMIKGFHGPRLGDPDQFDEQRFNQLKPDKHQIIFPIFPTVYDPREYLDHDMEFYKAIYAKANISSEHSVLVVGPGSGIDAWIASLRTGQKIYAVGINPLEIANLKVLAKIAGFEVEAKVHDNIISENGTPAFERDFDRIIWNMPSYTYELRFHQAIFGYPPQGEIQEHRYSRGRKLEEWHDSDDQGAILKRFAKGLPLVLRPGGLALVWNAVHPKLDFVREILQAAGLYIRVEDVKNFDARNHFISSRPFLYFVEFPEAGGPQARDGGGKIDYRPETIDQRPKTARDGRHRLQLQRHQAPVLEGASFPGAEPLPRLQKPVAVESGV